MLTPPAPPHLWVFAPLIPYLRVLSSAVENPELGNINVYLTLKQHRGRVTNPCPQSEITGSLLIPPKLSF